MSQGLKPMLMLHRYAGTEVRPYLKAGTFGGVALDAGGLGDWTLRGVRPAVAIRFDPVYDSEELPVDGRRDRSHFAVGDHDAVDGASERDLGCGSAEEGFVADVEQLARQRLLDDGNVQRLSDRQHGVARDSIEHRVRQRRGVQNASANQEEVFARAFREVAVHIERDSLGVAIDLGLHADELRVHIIRASLGERRHGVRREPVPTRDTDIRAIVAGDIFAPRKVRNIQLDRGFQRTHTDLAVPAKRDGPDVARRNAIRLDQVDYGGAQFFEVVAARHATDARRT